MILFTTIIINVLKILSKSILTYIIPNKSKYMYLKYV